MVICPRQYNLILQQKQQQQQQQPLMINDNKQSENEINNISSLKTCFCEFKGKLKDLSLHLKTICPLMPLECSFKSFGCSFPLLKYNFEQHMMVQMQYHLDLVMNQFNSFQKQQQLDLQLIHSVFQQLQLQKQQTASSQEELKKLRLEKSEQSQQIETLKQQLKQAKKKNEMQSVKKEVEKVEKKTKGKGRE